MVEQNIQKKAMKIDLQKMKSFLDVAKKYLGSVYNFFKDNKNNSKVMLFLAIITFGIAVYFGIQLYGDIMYLKNKTPELAAIKSYDIRELQANELTQDIVKTSSSLSDLLEEDTLIG
jgi:hypothetical protein